MNLKRSLVLVAACLVSSVALAKKEELPAVSHDGLELRKGKVADVVYVRPGVDFSKDWERERKGGCKVVTEGAEDVLVLRPAIIDLEVSAPDTMSAGRSYTLSDSAGGMTLYLEIYDSVTNKSGADRILRRWASALRERLDEVRGKAGGG